MNNRPDRTETIILLAWLFFVAVMVIVGLAKDCNNARARSLVKSGMCRPSRAAMEALIVKHGQGHLGRRRIVAKQLSARIEVESKRFGLDPVAMLAVASVESDFRSNVRGRVRPGSRRSAEVGVWQLIPGDSPVIKARMELDRLCFGSISLPKCPSDVRAAKRRMGRLHPVQLAGITLSTWIFAWELTYHVRACQARHPRGHRIGSGVPKWLARWGHYNSGPRKPTTWYLYKLRRQYRKFRRELCRKGIVRSR